MSTQAEMMGDRAGEIQELIHALGASGATKPHEARERLVEMGPAAVPALVEALKDRNTQLRWEAAKALGGIRAPSSADALAELLRDEDGGVRWVAADALIGMGRDGLPAVLHALLAHSGSAVVRHGAHHILGKLSERPALAPILKPIVTALDGQAPQVACLAPTEAALRALDSR
jgi:HEAT repeat protein